MKNLKMFAIGLASMGVMAMGVSATNVDCDQDPAFKVSITNKDKETTFVCANTLKDALDNATDADSTYVVDVLKKVNAAETSAVNITNGNVTLNLNDYKLDLGSNSLTVAAGKLTIVGKTDSKSILTTNATEALIVVNPGASLETKGALTLKQNGTGDHSNVVSVYGEAAPADAAKAKSEVTFGADTKAESSKNGVVLYSENKAAAAALGVTINMNGNWDVERYAVKVNGNVAYTTNTYLLSTVNVTAGTYDAEGTALYASGYAKWNVSGGTISGGQAVQVNNGVVKITGGTFTADGPNAGKVGHAEDSGAAIIVVSKTSGGYGTADHINLNIEKGKFTSENDYAIRITGTNVEQGEFAISGGEYKSGTDLETGKALPAMIIADNTAFLDENEGMITGGTFVNGIIGDFKKADNTYMAASDVIAKLVNGDVTVADGNTSVDDNKGEENQGNTENNGSENQGNQGGTENVKNPETNDNILVYAGLGLVSLASVAFTAKKRED